MKSFLLIFFLFLSGLTFSQQLTDYNDFYFGMSKDSAIGRCKEQNYLWDTSYYKKDGMRYFFYDNYLIYFDSINIKSVYFPMEVTLLFDENNKNELFDIDVGIKKEGFGINLSNMFFSWLLELMREKYGGSFTYTDYTDTTEKKFNYANRKTYTYRWNLNNGKVFLIHDVSSFYKIGGDFVYTDEKVEKGFFEASISYINDEYFDRYMKSISKEIEKEKEKSKKKL